MVVAAPALGPGLIHVPVLLRVVYFGDLIFFLIYNLYLLDAVSGTRSSDNSWPLLPQEHLIRHIVFTILLAQLVVRRIGEVKSVVALQRATTGMLAARVTPSQQSGASALNFLCYFNGGDCLRLFPANYSPNLWYRPVRVDSAAVIALAAVLLSGIRLR